MTKDTGKLAIVTNASTEAEVGETNIPNYLRPLLNLIQDGTINPSFVTHWLALNDATSGTSTFINE